MGRFPHLMLLSVFPGLLVSEKREKKEKTERDGKTCGAVSH